MFYGKFHNILILISYTVCNLNIQDETDIFMILPENVKARPERSKQLDVNRVNENPIDFSKVTTAQLHAAKDSPIFSKDRNRVLMGEDKKMRPIPHEATHTIITRLPL